MIYGGTNTVRVISQRAGGETPTSSQESRARGYSPGMRTRVPYVIRSPRQVEARKMQAKVGYKRSTKHTDFASLSFEMQFTEHRTTSNMSAMLALTLLLGLAWCVVPFTSGPHVSEMRYRSQQPSRCASAPLALIPELGAVDLTIAVVSAMAGAASQIPRISELEEQRGALERELSVAKEALSESEAQLVTKVVELEDAIFRMDQEFEGQTDRIKKQYDDRLRNELEALTIRLRTQFKDQAERLKVTYEAETQLRLEDQKGKLRQDFLKEKLDYMSGFTNRQDQLASLRLEQVRVEAANRELEDALMASRKELEQLEKLAKKKEAWW